METKATRAPKTRAHTAVCQPLAEMFTLTTRSEKAEARNRFSQHSDLARVERTARGANCGLGGDGNRHFASVGASGTGAAGDLP